MKVNGISVVIKIKGENVDDTKRLNDWSSIFTAVEESQQPAQIFNSFTESIPLLWINRTVSELKSSNARWDVKEAVVEIVDNQIIEGSEFIYLRILIRSYNKD